MTFGLFREAAETYQVPNDSLIIEKGQKILIPIFSLHSDHRYFNDPELFDPERFSPEEKAKRPNSVYIPFGDGPRVCIGTFNKKTWFRNLIDNNRHVHKNKFGGGGVL